MFSLSDSAPRHTLTGAQAQTHVEKKKTETNKKKEQKKREMGTGVMQGRGVLRKGLSTGC